MKFAVFATLLATASAFSVERADLGKVRDSEEISGAIKSRR